MRLLVTRPDAEGAALAATLAARGHDALRDPLLTIRIDPQAMPPLDGVAGLLFTSANGARAFAALSARRDLPVHAVGAATAAAARAAGFATVTSADGDVATLAAAVAARCRPEDGPLLHAAGSVRAGDLAGRLAALGFAVRVAALYAADPAPRLSAAARQALETRALDGVLLFSPRTSAHFAVLATAETLADHLDSVTLYALSQAVAQAADALPWKRHRIAPIPETAALLDLVDADARKETP
jgi:uroporphyrinogen-III synthase